MEVIIIQTRRAVQTFVLLSLAALFLAACADQLPSNEPIPTLDVIDAGLQPTPTLNPQVPTPIENSNGTPEAEEPPASSPTPTPTPSATPDLSTRFVIGDKAMSYGDYAAAAEQFQAALQQDPTPDPLTQQMALKQLGLAYLAEEQYGDAATMFNQYLGIAGEGAAPEIHFYLGQAHAGFGDYHLAIDAFQTYLQGNPEMAAYIYPLIAEAYFSLDDSQAALAAYESAAAAESHRLHEIEIRQILADSYLQAGDYEAAIEQYGTIHDLAITENTRGLMTYLAGSAELAAGNTDAAYERFLFGVDQYPGAYESYLGLVELVKAEVPVDAYQRGLVDYFAAAYAPGIAAFEDHIAGNPEDYVPEAHLYLAWSHEALAELELAFAELDRYAAFEPAAALLEKAKMRARAGDLERATAHYQEYLDDYSESEEAPNAAWWLAVLTEQGGDNARAADLFARFADDYPDHQDASEALYRAGWLAQESDDLEQARDLWLRTAVQYPASEDGSAALVRLWRSSSDEDGELRDELTTLIENQNKADYYTLRGKDLAADREPFALGDPFLIPNDDTSELQKADAWLLDLLAEAGIEPEGQPHDLSPELLADPRRIIGEKLWQLGLWEEAKRELEGLRESNADAILPSYQLALYFRDLGLYRSSIIAAATLLDLAEQSIFDAPPFIGRLAYPVYYADLILPLAEEYGYDPRLQFSLVRQESLFESFARSGAAAQGLSQVIPDTGAWIAERLQWPDYENDDLYKPYVGLNFGAYYLHQQLQAFDGDVHAALAAYNAGPGNAIRWHETAGSDLDQFVDTVDFAETRTYIERIYAGFDIYRYLYGELEN